MSRAIDSIHLKNLNITFGIHWIFVSPSFLMCYAQCCHGDGRGVRHVHAMHSVAMAMVVV